MIKSILIYISLLTLILGFTEQSFALEATDVFTKYEVKQQDTTGYSSNEDLHYVQNLPDQDYKTFVASVIRLALGLIGTLCFISISVSGIMFVFSPADSEMQTKAKNILKFSLYGVVTIGLAYSIIYGIA